jgi:hypothetical protein
MNFTSPTRALVWREVRASLWRWRTFAIVVMWLACAFLVPYTLWPEGMMPPMQFASQARQMIMALCSVVLVGIGLTVPATAAVSISSERDEELLDQLRLTLITNGGLVRGKAVASLLFSVLLLVSLFPVFSVVQFIFGLDNRQIAQLLAYLLVFSLMCAMCGIASSTLFRRMLAAVAAAYGFMSLLLFLPAFSFWRFNVLLNRPLGGGIGSLGVKDSWDVISPLNAIVEIISFGMTPGQFAIACGIPLAITVVMYAIAVRRVARVTEPARITLEKPVDDRAVLHARRTQFPFYLIDPLRRKPVIADGKNPMVVREIRWGLFSRGTWMARVFYGTFIVFIFPMLGACMNTDADERIGVLCVQMVMVVFAAPVLVGSAWTKERELGNIDMIRMTLLRARDLYIGKSAGGFMALAPVLAALMLTTVPAFVWHRGESVLLVCGCITLLNCALIALALSLYGSIASRRTTTSIAVGVVLCAAAFFGLYVAGLIFLNAESQGYSGESPSILRMLSPIVSYEESFWNTGRRMRDLGWFSYDLISWAKSQLAFAGVAGVFVIMSMYRLARREMRDR